MAIDSDQKRLSALSFNSVFIPGLVPDGTIDSTDRQAICFAFSGVAAQTPTAATGRPSASNIWAFT